MTDLQKGTAATLAAFLVTYLLAAFVAWDADPSNWDWAARLACALSGSFVALMCLLIVHAAGDDA